MKKIIIIIMILMLTPQKISAASDAQMLQEQLDMLDFSGVSTIIDKSGNSEVSNINIIDLVLRAVKGELDLSPANIINMIMRSFFDEVVSLVSLMKHMLVIAILSAFFKALSSSFANSSIAELGFYANYIVIISVLISSFTICLGIMQDMISEICGLIVAAQPLLMSIVMLSGNVAGAYALNPVILFFSGLLANLIQIYLTPVLFAAAALRIVNYLSEKDRVGKLSELMQKIVSWALKMTSLIFISVLSLQRISAPILNNTIVKSAKTAVNLVPVVGQALTGAVDAVLYWSGAVKSGVMVAVIIVIIVMCTAPILKIAAFVLVYKLTAGIIQPICDDRIVDAIDAAGSFASLILGACAMVAAMFIFTVIIMLSF